MASIYFNSEIIGNTVPYAEKFRGFCFRPLHYFLEGKTRTWHGERFHDNLTYYSYQQKSWPNSLKMAVLIIPSLIIGTIATIVAWASWYFAGNLPYLQNALHIEWAKTYEEPLYIAKDKADSSFVPPTYPFPENFSLNRCHSELHSKWMNFISTKLRTPNWWNDQNIRQELGELIEEAHKKMCLLFQHLEKKAKSDVQSMADLMADQHIQHTEDEENYSRAFFYSSIGTMYFCAITRQSFQGDNNRGYQPVVNIPHEKDSLSLKNTKPFFTPGTPEYRWRRLYNHACALIDSYPGLRKALLSREGRYLKCAIPHTSPSLKPSGWDDTPSFYRFMA